MEDPPTRSHHYCRRPSCEPGKILHTLCLGVRGGYCLAISFPEYGKLTVSIPFPQFVDSLVLMRVIRSEAHRRISWLIAEKSFRRKFIGLLARGIGTLPVARAMDNLKPGTGTIYLPDPINQPTVLRGVGTNFDSAPFEKEGTIALPTINGTSHSAAIAEINGPEELILKKPFAHRDALSQLTGRKDIDSEGNFTGDAADKNPEFKGTKFKVAPHVDQTAVYKAVFARLNAGGCVGIFPEGGSHDRPSLLPLKGKIQLYLNSFC